MSASLPALFVRLYLLSKAACSLGLSGGLGLLLALEIEHDLDEELSEAGPIERLSFKVQTDLNVRLALFVSLSHACEEWVVQGLVHTNAEVGVEL